MSGLELLTSQEMGAADRQAVVLGVASLTLMENAGRCVADAVATLAPAGGRIGVLAGPGNNGGDGFVAARLLEERGFDVLLGLLGSTAELRGDAAVMAGRWTGEVRPAGALALEDCDVIVDALFGAGLSRPLEGQAAEVVEAINAAGKPVVAVDVPSGLDGSTGEAAGPVVRATHTVTFFRRKPGHVLLPGRLLCGAVTVADIAIPEAVLAAVRPQTFLNGPALWLGSFPWPRLEGHKYSRGHAVVVSGPAAATGAARLGARGALRVGAGLVTVAAEQEAVAVNAAHLTAIMLRAYRGPLGLAELLSDARKNAVLIGPGRGVGTDVVEEVMTLLATAAAVVLDADALTAFADGQENGGSAFGFTPMSARAPSPGRAGLMSAIKRRQAAVVLTPHEGEFQRLFPGLSGSKLERVRTAAQDSGAVVVLKGPDTVIAAPDGRAVINDNGPPWLASAGTGDVLAGFVTGLLAAGMPAFPAASAAVWLHGACAAARGPGLIAEDLPERLPEILDRLHRAAGRPNWDPAKSNGGIG